MAPQNIHWRDLESTTSSGSSRRSGGSDTSDESYRSRRNAAVAAAAAAARSQRPPLPKPETWHAPTDRRDEHFYDEPVEYYETRSSVDTYASTSEEELEEDEEEDDYPPYEIPEYRHEVFPTDAIPATPRDFAELFPSSSRLSIRHDDATLDGNMNLRIDTQVEMRRGKQLVTLFHLRMHDLKSRDFSLRRYCRDSGREVCHCVRKYQKPASERPALQRSFSSAIATFRHKPERRGSATSSLKRQDSGYGSIVAGAGDDESRPKSAGQPKRAQLIPTNTMKLEFSNYAHVDVKRRGTKSSKRYEFEYWGVNYSWKRISKRDGNFDEISYHLTRSDSPNPLAHIVPVPLTNAQAREEAEKGGWIPPCSMWISDQSIIDGGADTADVIVSSGIMALVDDSIKNHFHSKESTQIHIPLSRNASFKLNMDYVGPKRLIDEVFHRNTRGSTSPRGPTPLRRTSMDT